MACENCKALTAELAEAAADIKTLREELEMAYDQIKWAPARRRDDDTE